MLILSDWICALNYKIKWIIINYVQVNLVGGKQKLRS